MGCWNKTCALSNLPIHAGERVYVFALSESPFFKEEPACYTDYMYSPILLPFESDYDDYGSGECSSGASLPVVLNLISKNLIEKELGENEFHDVEVKREGFDEDAFYTSAREGRLEVSTEYGPVKVDFVMMKKSVVDKVLDSWQTEDYLNGRVVFTFKDVVESVDDLMEGVKKTYQKLESLKEYATDSILSDPVGAYMWFERGVLASKFLRNRILSHHQNPIFTPAQVFVEVFKSGDFELAKSLLIDYIRGVFVDSFMYSVRRLWVPPCGEGSQSENYGEHRILAKAVLDEVEAYEKEMAEYEEEWESEESVEQSFLGYDFATTDTPP
jgi:hypothetical protein